MESGLKFVIDYFWLPSHPVNWFNFLRYIFADNIINLTNNSACDWRSRLPWCNLAFIINNYAFGLTFIKQFVLRNTRLLSYYSHWNIANLRIWFKGNSDHSYESNEAVKRKVPNWDIWMVLTVIIFSATYIKKSLVWRNSSHSKCSLIKKLYINVQYMEKRRKCKKWWIKIKIILKLCKEVLVDRALCFENCWKLQLSTA